MKRKKVKSSSKLSKYILYFLFLFSLFVISYILINLIKINKIVCMAGTEACPNEMILEMQKISPNNYLKKKANIARYLYGNKYVESYFIQYQLPDVLKININLNRAKYAIYNKTTSKFILVDGKKIVIDEVPKTNLPYITVDNYDYKKGGTVNDRDQFSLLIIEKINWLYSIRSADLKLTDGYLEVRLNENIKVLFPLEGDLDYLIGSARIIFSRLNDESQGTKMNNIKEIDLRYKNPVLR